MKPLKVLRGWCWLSLCFFSCMIGVFDHVSAADLNLNSVKNYVVIGAFSFQKNAERYTSFAKEKELEAVYEINYSRNLFYVYVYVSNEKNEADRELFRIRSLHPEFKDAWVYEGQLGAITNSVVNGISTDANESNDQDTSDNTAIENRVNTQNADSQISEVVSHQQEPSENENTKQAEQVVKAVPKTSEKLEKEEGVHHFYFNLLNSKKLREVKGRVKIIDPERAKQLMVANSHEIVNVRQPNNGTNRIKVASDIFGFKEVQYTIDLDDPVTDSTSAYIDTIGDSIIVNFELERYKKGDVLVMYNVYFFRDAAIMKSESIYELNSLLDMLQENEKYKVRIHGHTNGNSHGKIIHLDPDDKNFFTLNANHKEDNGSAKKLSLYRAYTIQHWLIDQGIAEDRMEIRGWGGRKMIYDKHDTQADKNVRVEIEITADQ
ncbi:MAG: OmpA family protein [Bacteroidota bacterium]